MNIGHVTHTRQLRYHVDNNGVKWQRVIAESYRKHMCDLVVRLRYDVTMAGLVRGRCQKGNALVWLAQAPRRETPYCQV